MAPDDNSTDYLIYVCMHCSPYFMFGSVINAFETRNLARRI